MITIMNYAEYIKVDTKLMMVLLAIALYVTAKQSKNQNTSKHVEGLDGSTVAFDKEAFVNLNAIVNELVKKDSVTIPGNLIVKGTTTMEKDLNVHTSVNVGTDDNNAIRLRQNRIGTKGCGEIEFHMTNGWLRHYNYGTSEYRSGCGFASGAMWSTGTMNVQGALTVDGVTKCNGQFRSEGEGVFRMPNGHYSHINASDGTCYIRGNILMDGHGGSGSGITCGALTVSGATVLKGTLNAHGQVTCNNTTIGGLTVTGDIKAGGDAYANAFLFKDNVNQGLLFNQGDRQIRLASGTANAMLDFDNKHNVWLLSYAANKYYQFSDSNLDWVRPGTHTHGVSWTY
tara:strand:+ start:790 stop:1815 length:1026 start_codon:yes stop_codon:yes gene_type:complete